MAGLLILLAAFVTEPEDTCSPYLMNMVYATPSPRWSVFYDSATAGLLTLQGSLDDEFWFQVYQAKFDYTIYKGFRLRYRYLRLQDYGIAQEIHRIEPTLRLAGNLYCHFFYIPTFDKKFHEIGLGLSLFYNNPNYIQGFFSIKDFENNFSQRAVPPDKPRDLYTKQPLRLALEARRDFKFGFAKIYGEYITPSIKEYDTPHPGGDHLTYFSSFSTDGRFELRPLIFFGFGGTFSYNHFGEMIAYPSLSPLTDTLSDLTIEPYSFVPINQQLTFTLRLRYNRKLHNLYERHWFAPGLLFEYKANAKIVYSLGYQHSWRKRFAAGTALVTNYDTHNRLDLFFEYIFNHRGSIVIKEGIDLDNLFYHNLGYFLHHPHDMWYWGMVVRF